ncbi:MAG: 4Fe-4S dicluster domain-containing protein [Calditrichaeota bacterium]|nr:MAG: 4Fe-4S dicluster domain-containing protein [Calditrichota bacterium]
MFETVTYFIAALCIIFIPYIYWKKHSGKEKKAVQLYSENLKTGYTEPVTLHPKIDPNQCIMTGACVKACPEGEILGIVKGKAQIIQPSRCIGHGACQSACPTDAISLVFGTKKRGIDIPMVKETFETNVPGIYIAGELGGMGLIRNAITQGKEAVEYIAKSLNGTRGNGTVDLAIIGAGPAGIAASLQAKKDGLSYITLEQEKDFGGTVAAFPRQKLVMTQPMDIPLYGKFKNREIQKEELIELWKQVTSQNDIQLTLQSKVESIKKEDELFSITSTSGVYKAKKVLLTIGRRGTPRKLGVQGEKTNKVTYNLLDPEQYKNKHLLVVGGGDSAVEAALRLGEQEGTTVTLSYRKDTFSRIKDKNREKIETAHQARWVNIIFNSQIESIHSDHIILNHDSKSEQIKNNYVFIFIGGELPNKFLSQIGIEMETKFGVR